MEGVVRERDSRGGSNGGMGTVHTYHTCLTEPLEEHSLSDFIMKVPHVQGGDGVAGLVVHCHFTSHHVF